MLRRLLQRHDLALSDVALDLLLAHALRPGVVGGRTSQLKDELGRQLDTMAFRYGVGRGSRANCCTDLTNGREKAGASE